MMKRNAGIFSCVALASMMAFSGNASAACSFSSNNVMKNIVAAAIDGKQERINRRKTFVIHEVTDAKIPTGDQPANCDRSTIVIDMNVTLKRKIRRDAHGTATLKGKLDFISGRGLCLVDAEMTRLKLSRTTGLAEAIYRKFAGGTYCAE